VPQDAVRRPEGREIVIAGPIKPEQIRLVPSSTNDQLEGVGKSIGLILHLDREIVEAFRRSLPPLR
jgi:hypothetical protein